ncbi:MAG: protein kinase [Kofleriaceae bacterium]
MSITTGSGRTKEPSTDARHGDAETGVTAGVGGATSARTPGTGIELSEHPTGAAAEGALELAPGALVEQYEIMRELGRGGMGQVYLARDTKLGRVVAIKFLTRTSETFVKRFLIEAQTTAQVTHENIVVIHEAGTHRGHPYMVLEFLEGDPLSKIIKGRALSPARTVELMVPVARALIRAHAFGIVHRDLKPDNIFVTQSGTVKVLDFGVAKLFGDGEDDPVSNTRSLQPVIGGGNMYETLSTGGAVVGTLPFMSPEQFGADVVDERTDLWACGVIMFRLLSGAHPLPEVSNAGLMFAARDLETPHRSLGEVAPGVPDALIRLVDRLLRKPKAERTGSATELLAELEALLPTKAGRRLGDEECPYPGLSAFEEGDADRFFGRGREIARAVTLMREHPVLAIVGPSGAGKSSFVRAGLIPELRAQGAPWETFILRPGRDPMAALAPLVEALTGKPAELAALRSRLRHEPGYVGALLRDRARQKHARVLVLIDQFEELYTLVADEDERVRFTEVLLAIADDAGSPLRLILSCRSDFLHRIAESARFTDAVMRGLLLLGPPDKEGLREAIVGPAEKADYRFENAAMVEAMLDELRGASAPYPLLQFCLANLWRERDGRARVLPEAAFQQMGGVAGALAAHADQLLATLSQRAQLIARAIFQRLVTSEGTRAIVDLDELEAVGDDPAEVGRVLGAFVDARLLVRHQDTRTVEIVHEALVAQWPTLRRWMDEGKDDVVLVEQVRAASRQWEQHGRSRDHLWRGQAAKDAAAFSDRLGSSLAPREREFLAAVLAADKRAGRRKSVVVGVVITTLAGMVAASVIGLIAIRGAEGKAREALAGAQASEHTAKAEAERAKAAEADARTKAIEAEQAKNAFIAAEQERIEAAKQVDAKNKELAALLAASDVQKAELERKNQEVAAALVALKEQTAEADRAREVAARASAGQKAERDRECEAAIIKLAALAQYDNSQPRLPKECRAR